MSLLLRHVAIGAARALFALLLIVPFVWANGILSWSVLWSSITIGAALLSVGDRRFYRRLPLFPPEVWRLGLLGALLILPLVIEAERVRRYPGMALFFGLTLILLYGLSLVYSRPRAVQRLVGAVAGLIFSLILVELLSGVLLTRIETASRAPSIAPAPTVEPTFPPTPESTLSFQVAPTQSATPEPTPVVTLTQLPTPATPSLIAGLGYVDYLEDGGQAEWSQYTGYGARINSTFRTYMVDAQGKLVYDNTIRLNGKGMRGPEVAYDKPADVYRILIIGDSFVEAVQVPDEQTFAAQLSQALAGITPNVPGKTRFEVAAMGRMGWGTLQEYLYYQVEGAKFNPDLVILSFYINDVPDNRPAFFYPNINNTNYDFVFEGDSVRIVDTNLQPLPPNGARLLYNGLSPVFQGTNLARLMIRWFDPPPDVRPQDGVLDRVHPQWYIYVSDPPIPGFEEAWRRTAWGLTHFAQAVTKHGAKFAVMPIFIGTEQVLNVSQWYPELVKGWQWDVNLPDERLAQILRDQPALIFPTRPTFEAYAQAQKGQVFQLLYIQEDRHFNGLGHRLTSAALLAGLREAGIAPH